MTTGTTIVVGLNAALQKRLVLEAPLVPGNVVRASQLHVGTGGKGQDVVTTLHSLQYPSSDYVIAQFIGNGPEGDQVYDQLYNLLGPVPMSLTIRPASLLRTCTSIVAPDVTTEVVEPSGEILLPELEELLGRMDQLTSDALCFMGSLPPGCPDDTYATIYAKTATPHTLCVIDSVVGLSELLQCIRGTPHHGPVMLKINASELCRLAKVDKQNDEAGGVAVAELVQAVQSLIQKFPTQPLSAVCVTDGPHPGYVIAMPNALEDEFRLFQLPVVNLTTYFAETSSDAPVLYPIGAGDAVAAGTLAAWHTIVRQGTRLPPELQTLLKGNASPSIRAILAAFSFGLACGAASCLQEANSVVRLADVISLYQREGRPIFMSSHTVL